jgi:ribose transport system permease protein
MTTESRDLQQELPLGERPSATRATSLQARIAWIVRNYAVFILLIILVIIFGSLAPGFLTWTNFLNIVNQNVPLAIIAVAGTLAIISGNFDLSTGGIYAVVGMGTAWVANATSNIPLSMITGVAIGGVLGLFNGLVVTRLQVHAFLATLASNMVFSSVAVLITNGQLITVNSTGFTDLGRGSWIGVPYAVWVLIAAFIVGTIVLNRTRFGRHVFAVGGNPDAATMSGISTHTVYVWVFVASGLAAGIGGIIGVSLIGSGQPLAGSDLAFEAIAGVILGGTSIVGGAGAVWRSILGVLLIALIGNGFDLAQLNPQLEDFVTGLVIIAAVAVASLGRKQRLSIKRSDDSAYAPASVQDAGTGQPCLSAEDEEEVDDATFAVTRCPARQLLDRCVALAREPDRART